MQENKIKLSNKYNEEVYLEKIKDNKYKLVHKFLCKIKNY